MGIIHIARNGQPLGIFSEDQLREGILSGQFTATDLYWLQGTTDWRPLSELAAQWGLEIPLPPPLPTLSIPNDGTEPAWERRKEIGFFPAIFQTITGVLFRPSATFANLKQTGGFGVPLVYNLILMAVLMILIFSTEAIFIGSTLKHLPPFQGATYPSTTGTTPFPAPTAGNSFAHGISHIGPFVWVFLSIGIVIDIIFAIGSVAAMLFIAAGIHHLALKLLGGARRPFETTFRVYAYVQASTSIVFGGIAGLILLAVFGFIGFGSLHGTHVLGMGIAAVVFVGLYAILYLTGVIWSLYCHIVGVKEAHGIEYWRATLAVLLPIIICCSCMLLFYSMLIGVIGAVLSIHPTIHH